MVEAEKNKVLDDYTGRVKSLIYGEMSDYDESNDKHFEIWESEIDEIAEQLKENN